MVIDGQIPEIVSRPKDINSLSNTLFNSKIGIKTANMYIALCSKYCSKHCAYVHPLNPDQQSYEVGIIFFLRHRKI